MDSNDNTTSSQREASSEPPSFSARSLNIDYAHNAFQLPPPTPYKCPVTTSQWSQPTTTIASLGNLLTPPNDIPTNRGAIRTDGRLVSYNQPPIANDRPFKCDQCPLSFNQNHDLKRHKRIHLAVKLFICNHCDKRFSRIDALKRHIRVKGCGKVPAYSDESKGETTAPKEAEWTDTSDMPRSSQSEPPTPAQEQATFKYKASDPRDDEDLYTSAQELTVANIVKVLLRVIDAAKKASVKDVGEYLEAWTGFDLSGTDLLRQLCSPWSFQSNTAARTKAVTDYVHAVLVAAQWRDYVRSRRYERSLDCTIAGPHHKHVDFESDKDLSSNALGELRLTSFPKSLERLWLSEVVDRTVDAFLYRWNGEYQRWLQYRWDAACAIYYSRIHIDGKR
ncbi:hypothetical protein FB567DRAFT_35583 [Paraphoma chrysanthemicola]|uniref:C2H2-type domain-containing protein n=1 Tax=Paraphoma chrysanthemicola TaxID=798071 RepID=A0A8K0W589_9PLEO|nr:hypothetical protein FB567DRAFT_35583 [Paraphoma chrysanthemicola]